jgi:hypothetical protein
MESSQWKNLYVLVIVHMFWYLSDVIVCKLAMHIAEMPQHIIGSVSETKAVSVK